MEVPKYRRILLKISGEALAGESGSGLDFGFIGKVCQAIRHCTQQGVQVAIVVGGGNFWRGARAAGTQMERSRADQMGMLATVINCLALAECLQQCGVEARVQTAVEMQEIAELYIRNKAVSHLEKGRVVVLGCGTGSPYFTTDTGAVLRGVELNVDAVLLAKNVDGVYDSDPKKNPNAKRFDQITYDDILKNHLSVVDFTATSLAMDNRLPLVLFALEDPENIYRVVMGEDLGTIVKEAF